MYEIIKNYKVSSFKNEYKKVILIINLIYKKIQKKTKANKKNVEYKKVRLIIKYYKKRK